MAVQTEKNKIWVQNVLRTLDTNEKESKYLKGLIQTIEKQPDMESFVITQILCTL